MFRRRTRITYLFALILTVFALLSLTACGIHFHKWEEATCISPKKCSDCGEKVGEPLVHKVPEDGICTLCERKLRNILTLEKEARPTSPIVYGGVFLRIYMYGTSMFPGSYTLYAEDGAEIASGDWGTIRPVEASPGLYKRPEFVETEYFPLQPGNYRVEYTYYTKDHYDDKGSKCFVPHPDADLVFVDYKFTVK